MPARYYPPRAHLLAINADWPPLVRAVERQAAGMSLSEAWEAACGLMEREAVDALGLAAHRRQLDSENLDEFLHDRLMERLPIVEQHLPTLRGGAASECGRSCLLPPSSEERCARRDAGRGTDG